MTTRVLFVDDEPRVLDGLRLSLRAKRKVWDLVFFESARAALEEVRVRGADVVVSDMRMPEMSGAELLGKVAELRPGAARIILSGQMDEGAAVRAASVAHRFLTKPCDPATLVSTIMQALEVNSWLRSDLLRNALGSLETLPALPQVCLSLDRAFADQDVTVGKVAAIIEGDPAVATKVLQLVNSSFFGLSRRMANVGQAVGYLGINTMRSLALADSLFHAFGAANVASLEREQECSLLRARVARRLFSDVKRAETASTAALLVDIGALALESRLPEERRAIRLEAEARGVPVEDVEQERLGVTHAQVGAYLLGLWGLPNEIVLAVAEHHAPLPEEGALDASLAVRIAEGLVSELFAPEKRPCAATLAAVVERLGLTETIERLRRELRESTEGAP